MTTAATTLDVLFSIAHDLTASLGSEDRYQRVLTALRQLIACDAACLLRLEGDTLRPLASHGLTAAAATRTYDRHRHPRLDRILRASGPVHFPADSDLPDPFDHGLLHYPAAVPGIHACLGCPLWDDGTVVGALTADAVELGAFDDIDEQVLATLGALAGATLRIASQMEAMERVAAHRGLVMHALQRSHRQPSGFIGASRGARAVLRAVATVSPSALPVLISGETGTGKELIARAVHEASPRRGETFLALNCAALPASVVESELFGHAAGAFTGAQGFRGGAFEAADEGTLFLDEIGELPLTAQAALLRAVQNGEIQRIGADRALRVDVRVVAATNRDLQREVAAGRFRADLYHRLAAFPITIPPLRERRDDIAILAQHILTAARHKLGTARLSFDPQALAALEKQSWPGNVRELENVIQRAVLIAANEDPTADAVTVHLRHLQLGPESLAEADLGLESHAATVDAPASASLRERTVSFQRREIERLLIHRSGNQAAVARELGLHRANLHRLVRRLGLETTP